MPDDKCGQVFTFDVLMAVIRYDHISAGYGERKSSCTFSSVTDVPPFDHGQGRRDQRIDRGGRHSSLRLSGLMGES